jgi:hypothetical protein
MYCTSKGSYPARHHHDIKQRHYAMNAIENATPGMLEKSETVRTPAPLHPLAAVEVDALPARLPVAILLLAPVPVAVDEAMGEAASDLKSV